MYTKNLFIGLALALLSLLGFLLMLWQGKNWIRNSSILDKMRRAALSGIGFALFFISGVAAIDYIGSPNVEKNWSLSTLGSLFCLISPMIALTMIGSFIWYLRRDDTQRFLSERLDHIIQKSKNPKQ